MSQDDWESSRLAEVRGVYTRRLAIAVGVVAGLGFAIGVVAAVLR